MKRYLLLLALALLGFASCSKEKASDPGDEDLKEEFQLKGSISGTVTDSSGEALSGVSVTAQPGGYATNTDTLGKYSIPDMPGDTYTVYFFKTHYVDTIVEDVVLNIDQDKRSVNMEMRFKVDSLVEEIIDSALRTVQAVGGLTDSADVESVGLVVKNLKGDTVPSVKATWNRTSGRYSLKLRVPEEGGSIEVKVRDAAGHLMGYHSESFDADTNQIQLATFEATNAQGKAKVVFSPATATVNDSIEAQLTISDTYGGKILRWWYKWHTAGKYTEGNSTKVSFETPGSPMESVAFMVKVLDDDSNLVEYELPFGKVVDDVPALSLGARKNNIPRDTNIAWGSTLKLTAEASDEGTLSLSWKMDDGAWTKGTKDYSKAFAADHEGFHTVQVMASDEDGNAKIDTLYVFVGPSFTDPRDKQRYRYTMIDGVPWMAEDLRYGGDGYYTWAEAFQIADSCNIKGCQDQVLDGVQGICPDGWHVATGPEWTDMAKVFGGDDEAAWDLKSSYAWGDNENGSGTSLMNIKPKGLFDEAGNFQDKRETFYWSLIEPEGFLKTEVYAHQIDAATNRIQYVGGKLKLFKLGLRCVGNMIPAVEILWEDGMQLAGVGEKRLFKVGRAQGTYLSPAFTVSWKLGDGAWQAPNLPNNGFEVNMPTQQGFVDVILRLTSAGVSNYDTIPVEVGGFKDTRDGQSYHTVVIDGVEWLRTNLRYAGLPGAATQVGVCNPEILPLCSQEFMDGRFYTWAEVKQGVCPPNTHVPSSDEWLALMVAVNPTDTATHAGDSLKATYGWEEITKLPDSYDFRLTAAGSKDESDIWNHAGYSAGQWTSSINPSTDPEEAFYVKFGVYTGYAIMDDALTTEDNRYSVRCIVDQ